jgi:methylenetetrahydrofolate dehydrogenase (NADP+)/methenyltetrahydrofolate cyclohydrolase
MKLFDGKKEAQKLDLLIEEKVLQEPSDGFLGIVMIGHDAASEKYVSLKLSLCKKYAIPCNVYRIKSNISDSAIEERLKTIIAENNLQGIIVQLPLPRESLNYLLNLIPLNKDLDLLSNTSMTQLRQNKSQFLPPVVRALNLFMAVNQIKTAGLNVVIIGGGRLVGEPLSYFLANNKANVTIMDGDVGVRENFADNSKVKIENDYTSGKKIEADLVIAATGKANLVRGEDLSPNTNLVDFGSVIKDGRIVGNFDKKSPSKHLGRVALVPGGMGPLVVRYLLMNLLHI